MVHIMTLVIPNFCPFSSISYCFQEICSGENSEASTARLLQAITKKQGLPAVG